MQQECVPSSSTVTLFPSPLHSIPFLLCSLPLSSSLPSSPLPPLTPPPPPPPNHHLHLQLAKVEKLKPTEVELKRLEDLAQSLVHDFAYMRAREEEMRDTNGTPMHTRAYALTLTALTQNTWHTHTRTLS